MTTGREMRMALMRRDVLKSTKYGPMTKPEFLYNDRNWGKDRSTSMSKIKSQASKRKQPITLPKIKLPE